MVPKDPSNPWEHSYLNGAVKSPKPPIKSMQVPPFRHGLQLQNDDPVVTNGDGVVKTFSQKGP